MAMVNGPLWGLIAIEGGGFHLFVLIISIISLSLLRKHMKNHKLDIDKYPYTKYFFVSCYSMVFFILGYMLLFGAFTQPSDLGFQLSF